MHLWLNVGDNGKQDETMKGYTSDMAVDAIKIAMTHEPSATSMASSAKVAREDAQWCMERGMFESAICRSRDSISYSLGIFSDPYKTLTAML
jgi:hypothetical protein